jgi:ATP-dependent DNA helicase RecG
LGVKLSDQEAAVFAFLIRKGEVDLADIKALTGLPGPAARDLAQRLTVQVILGPAPGSESKFALVDHLRQRFLPDGAEKGVPDQQTVGSPGDKEPTEQVTAQVTEQVGEKATEQVEPLRELTEVQWLIVASADAPRSIGELMAATGYKQRPYFKATHLKPLLDGGVIRMTVPDKPNSSKQKYVLTDAGLKLKALRISESQDKKNENDSHS